MKLVIEMIPDDVTDGLPGNAFQCPIAKALNRLYPLTESFSWFVGRESITIIKDNDALTAKSICEYEMPMKAQRFITLVDRAGEYERYTRLYHVEKPRPRPKPIKFVAVLPDECVKGALAPA